MDRYFMNTYLTIQDHKDPGKADIYFESGPAQFSAPRVGETLRYENQSYVVKEVAWELYQTKSEAEWHCVVLIGQK